ncbi:9869_t:CDS:2 [Diversispora eburnea]|uniref:9869_t:CDS:1 n=1 Tax=Diversispora eburnea TaxID=1213867 RepID=A0A9N8V0V2_9GLOM|nr:9869_t:CDS:2 [Diversispora eburnea]
MSISQDTTRIIYKVPNSREEFFVFGYPEAIKKWRKDKTISMTESYDVFETVTGGNEGMAGRPSKWKLENAFGTSVIEDVIRIILEEGNFHRDHKGHDRHASKDRTMINETRGKGVATTEGSCGIHN